MNIFQEAAMSMVFAITFLILTPWSEVPGWFGTLAFVPLVVFMLGEGIAIRRDYALIERLQVREAVESEES